MQASVHRYDDVTGDGSVLLDDGREVSFDGVTFDRSGLRHLRTGQRVSIDLDGKSVTRLWVVGVGPGEHIR